MRRRAAGLVALAVLAQSWPAAACQCCDASASVPVEFRALSEQARGERQHWRYLVAPAETAAASASEPAEPGLEAVMEADHLELVDDEQGASLWASGSIRATYQGFELQAQSLRLDRATMTGEASGTVRLNAGLYHLRAERLVFDLRAMTAEADDWQGLIEKQGWFGGRKLHLSPKLVYSEDARVSPCLHEDPGYWLSGERIEWLPDQATWNLRGSWVRVVVGGVTVLVLPFFTATIGQEAQRLKLDVPDNQIDASVGYNGAEGAFLDSRIKLDPAGVPIAVPVRVMSSRGVAAGVQQGFDVAGLQGRLDGNYTQYWPWQMPAPGTAEAGRQGLHSNLALVKDWGGGARTSMNLGYRVDLGFRNDAEYQVDPGGAPVHRLPELTTTFARLNLGPVGFDPSLRAGYLIEDFGEHGASGLLQTSLGVAFPSFQPLPFWSTGFYGGANASYYGTDRSQSTMVLGMVNSQSWSPKFSTSVTLETQPVLKTGQGSPFQHDRAAAVDRVVLGLNWNVWGPWSVGGGVLWARYHSAPLALESLQLGDLYLSGHYTLNCLSLGVTFRPPRGSQPFQYLFDYQVAAF